jgi:hypothetical protein
MSDYRGNTLKKKCKNFAKTKGGVKKHGETLYSEIRDIETRNGVDIITLKDGAACVITPDEVLYHLSVESCKDGSYPFKRFERY